MSKINVLYIDDELHNLNAFKATFRREFNIYLASTPQEALTILETNAVEVIISDQKMPQLTGVQFFEYILEVYPDPVRILLTGFSDVDAVINAINIGKVYSYVTKPWNDFDLRQMIQNASDLFILKKENKQLSSRYQNVFQTSSDLIVIFNKEGEILDFNAASKQRLAISYKSDIRKLVESKNDVSEIENQLKNKRSITDFECNFIDKNNQIINGIISANTLDDISGEATQCQLIVKDITKRKLADKQVFKKIIEAQEAERKRVADDLHDSLGQELSSVKMMVDVLRDATLAPEKKVEITERCHQILENSISDLRSICFDLMPSALANGGFVPAFKQLAKSLLIDVELQIETEVLPLRIETQIALYRVSQEFVHNTIKHGQASLIKLSLFFIGEKQLYVIFEDDGIGFDIDELSNSTGRGQNTMLKRIESYGGKSSIESKKGEGTKLKITFEC